jgi:hypothetical protein
MIWHTNDDQVSTRRRDIMMRVSVIIGAFVAALGLAPISADAQQIFACVNNNSGAVKIVAPNTPCSNNETPLVWPAGPTFVTCIGTQDPSVPLANGAVLTFGCPINNNLNAILTDGGAGATSGSFLMQAGTYHVEFYGNGSGCAQVDLTTNSIPTIVFPSSALTGTILCPAVPPFGIMAGAAVLQFTAGQVMQFTVTTMGSLSLRPTNVIITKLQ